jgi:hypothetical protein
MAWVGYIAIIIISAAAVISALGVIWLKVIKPLAAFIVLVGEMKPLLEDLTIVFKGKPDVFKVLNEIAGQFRTDSGSSLRDAVNGLTAAAAEQKAATETLRVVAKSAEQLSAEDRLQRERLILRIDRLSKNVDAGAATGLRNEAAAKVVAEDLAATHRTE